MAAPGTSEEIFWEKMKVVADHATLGHAMSLGYRLGLFKAMMEFTEPKTSQEIADKTGLNERYVREWLAIMVTSEIFTMSKEDDKYFMPRDRISFFKDAMYGLVFEMFSVMFPPITPQLEKCFREGGGIPYSDYKGFHQTMNGMSAQGQKLNLLQNHIPSIEGLCEKLEKGINYLDIGCGMGTPTLLMAEKYPNSNCYGFDFAEEAISTAEQKAKAMGLKNAHLKVVDCHIFDPAYAEMFDFITAFDAIHDQAYPAEVLSAIYRMLKPGGVFSMVDVSGHTHPVDNVGKSKATLKYSISLFHCMPVSLYFKGGAGLGTCWGQEMAVKMLQDAGFTVDEVQNYPGDFNVHYLARK
eukprot:gene12718-14023_t